MPRTPWQCSDDLFIQVDDFQGSYRPGDTLTGQVAQTDRVHTQPFSVKLSLWGRTKTKIRKHKGNNNYSTYRGGVNLFASHQVLQSSRPGTIPEGIVHAWPFSVTIPTHRRRPQPSPAQGSSGSNNTDLPPTFYCSGDGDNFVEYVLEAELGTTAGTKYQCALPLNVRAPAGQNFITDHRMTLATPATKVIRSPKVLRENADRDISFREKSRALFHRSRVPRYAFSVKVMYPKLIQLEHPDTIPLKVQVEPIFGDSDQATNFCADDDLTALPDVVFTSMKLVLRSRTALTAPGTFSEYHDSVKRDFAFPGNRTNVLSKEAVIPIARVMEEIKTSAPGSATLRPRDDYSLSPSHNNQSYSPAFTPSPTRSQNSVLLEPPSPDPSHRLSSLQGERPSPLEIDGHLAPLPPQASRLPSYEESAPTAPGGEASQQGPSSVIDESSSFGPSASAPPSPPAPAPSPGELPRYSTLPPPSIDTSSPANPSRPLHLGSLFNLNFHNPAHPVRGPLKYRPAPTFSTDNISHRHNLSWKIYYRVAGSEHSLSGDGGVTVLGAPEAYLDNLRWERSLLEEGRVQAVREWMQATGASTPGVRGPSSKIHLDRLCKEEGSWGQGI